MRISDISTAKGLKIKFTYSDSAAKEIDKKLIKITPTQIENEFIINTYGREIAPEKGINVLCKTDSISSKYITDLLETEKNNDFRCLFSVEEIHEDFLEIQAYTFKSVVEFKTPIYIQVSDQLFEKTNLEKLYRDYIWDGLGEPAIFCLNYKNNRKHNNLRFLSHNKYLIADNSLKGITATSEHYLKDRSYLPIDIYVGPEIRFVTNKEYSGINAELSEVINKPDSSQSYLFHWEVYNELNKKLIELEKEDFGKFKYTECTQDADLSGITFDFLLEEDFDEAYIGKELCISKQTEKNIEHTAVGSVKSVSGNKITTHLDMPDEFNPIPTQGTLELFTWGDEMIIRRRDMAKQRMLQHASPIKSIVELIEAGASDYKLSTDWKTEKAVTEELERNFKKATQLNSEQKKALDIAINTPDIALIQGPPGTGKTTVIKAICERFREIFEKEEREQKKLDPEHTIKSPKILISSFQNEAVDNAIASPLPGDIPAYRKTSKRAKETTKEQYQKALDNWYNGVKETVNDLIQDKSATAFVEEKNRLNDEYLSYKNSGESLEKAAQLIKHYLSFSEISYPNELITKAEAIIKTANCAINETDDEDPFIKKLELQRLDKESFSDDGAINANRLLATIKIREDLNIDNTDIEAISNVCTDLKDAESFQLYIDTINKLKKRFLKNELEIDVRDKNVINDCLISLFNCFDNQYIKTLTDLESKKSLILSEFLYKLSQDYEFVVKKYSMTTAATCQTSLDIKEHNHQVFDLVIVDEAARANPLDLFVPMSMGKKIILVGDHKQLPHMLEPDIINALKDDPKFEDFPNIEKSLFERLFDMFSKGAFPKSVLLTYQYRMHPDICKFVSEAFYEGKLKTAPEITPELRSSPTEINDGKPLTFVNVPYSRGGETSGISKSREIEVTAIAEEVKKIFEIDSNSNIGIITFYAAQKAKIEQRIKLILNDEQMSRVEIGTVDAFQGKEFDYVLLSCVRSNNIRGKAGMSEDEKTEVLKKSVGFMVKPNRLCVAFSRAIRQLILFGDAETLVQIPYFSKLYETCIEGGGCYREY